MCGLIGVFNTKEKPEPVNDTVLNLFENQKGRGQSGFGLIKIDEKLNIKVDRATEGFKLMWDIHQDLSPIMIMHHRSPTSTANLIKQTHPLFVSSGSLKYDYLVIHNGIITNADELKKEHEKLGFQYLTAMKEKSYYSGIKDVFNDSESFAIEFARYVEKQIDEMNIEGSAAFIAVQINKKATKVEQLLYGRTTSTPLKISKTRNFMILSSEGPGNEIKEKLLYSCKLNAEMKLSHSKIRLKEKTYTFPPDKYPCMGRRIRDLKETKTEKEHRATTRLLEEGKTNEGCVSLKDIREETANEAFWRNRGNDSIDSSTDWEPEDIDAVDAETDLAILIDEYNTTLTDLVNDFTTELEYNTIELEDLNIHVRLIMDAMEEARYKVEIRKKELSDLKKEEAIEAEKITTIRVNHANSAISE